MQNKDTVLTRRPYCFILRLTEADTGILLGSHEFIAGNDFFFRDVNRAKKY